MKLDMKILNKYVHEHLLFTYTILILVLLGGFFYFIFPLEFETRVPEVVEYSIENPNGILEPKVVIDKKVAFHVGIADDPLERTRGLSGVPSIEDYQGLLFVFREYDRYMFWMKDMEFDLDFIWIRDNVIVDIDTYASSDDDVEETIYSPLEDVNFVLEVNAGLVDQFGIEVGDRVMYHNIVFVPAEEEVDVDKN